MSQDVTQTREDGPDGCRKQNSEVQSLNLPKEVQSRQIQCRALWRPSRKTSDSALLSSTFHDSYVGVWQLNTGGNIKEITLVRPLRLALRRYFGSPQD